jgi:hypothetical protein
VPRRLPGEHEDERTAEAQHTRFEKNTCSAPLHAANVPPCPGPDNRTVGGNSVGNEKGGDRMVAARKMRSVCGSAQAPPGDLLVAPVEIPGAVDGPEA